MTSLIRQRHATSTSLRDLMNWLDPDDWDHILNDPYIRDLLGATVDDWFFKQVERANRKRERRKK